MNTIVDKLLDVDKQARQTLDGAQQYYDKTLEEIDVQKQKIRDKYFEKADKHIQDVTRISQEEATAAVAQIQSQHGAKIKALDDIFAAGNERWQQELFQRCLGR